MQDRFVKFGSIAIVAFIISAAIVMAVFGVGAGITDFKATATSTNSASVTLPTDVIQGDWIIVSVGNSNTGTSVSGIDDTPHSSFSQVIRSNVQTNVEIWIGHYTAATASDTIVVTMSASDAIRDINIEVANLLTGSIVNSSSGSGTSTCATCTASVTSITPLANSFCVASVMFDGTGAFTFGAWSDPFVSVVTSGGATIHFLATGVRTSWSGGATTATVTATHTSNTARWDEVLACWSGTGAELTTTTTTTAPTTTTTTTTAITTTIETTTNTQTSTTTVFNGTETITRTSTSTTTAVVVQNTTAQITLEAVAIGIILIIAIILITLWKGSGRVLGPIMGAFGGFAGIYLLLQIFASQAQGGIIMASGFNSTTNVFYNDVMDATPFIWLALLLTLLCFMAALYKAFRD